MSEDDVGAAVDAFQFVQMLRLRAQDSLRPRDGRLGAQPRRPGHAQQPRPPHPARGAAPGEQAAEPRRPRLPALRPALLSSLWPFRRARARLPAQTRALVERWHGLADYDRRRPVASGRWVVVDVESSGLDAVHDRSSPWERSPWSTAPLTSPTASRWSCAGAAARQDNIEVHGIGGRSRPRAWTGPGARAPSSTSWADPPVAFHAPFDAPCCAGDAHLPASPAERPWLDLAAVAPPRLAPVRPPLGLDDWLDRFAIDCAGRHHAAAMRSPRRSCPAPARPRRDARGRADFAGAAQGWRASSAGWRSGWRWRRPAADRVREHPRLSQPSPTP